jgi:hypothetical protein
MLKIETIRSREEAERVIWALLKEYVEDASDREADALALAREWSEEGEVKEAWAKVRAQKEAEAAFSRPEIQPSVESKPVAKLKRRMLLPSPKEPKPGAEPEAEAEPATRIMLPAVIPPPPPLAPPKSDWDEAVAAMNGQHAIIENVGGKTVIASCRQSISAA